jgi:hypothetical protein
MHDFKQGIYFQRVYVPGDRKPTMHSPESQFIFLDRSRFELSSCAVREKVAKTPPRDDGCVLLN